MRDHDDPELLAHLEAERAYYEASVRPLADLRAVGVDIVTIGQYLRPTARHRPVSRYVHPDEFRRYAGEGRRLGLSHVEAGPLVRSSYRAHESLEAAQ